MVHTSEGCSEDLKSGYSEAVKIIHGIVLKRAVIITIVFLVAFVLQ